MLTRSQWGLWDREAVSGARAGRTNPKQDAWYDDVRGLWGLLGDLQQDPGDLRRLPVTSAWCRDFPSVKAICDLP